MPRLRGCPGPDRDHRDICTHEFAHVIHRHGVDGRAKAAITAAFARAKAAGKWPGAYARTNEQEFFAEVWPKMAIEGGRPYLLPGFSVPN